MPEYNEAVTHNENLTFVLWKLFGKIEKNINLTPIYS